MCRFGNGSGLKRSSHKVWMSFFFLFLSFFRLQSLTILLHISRCKCPDFIKIEIDTSMQKSCMLKKIGTGNSKLLFRQLN